MRSRSRLRVQNEMNENDALRPIALIHEAVSQVAQMNDLPYSGFECPIIWSKEAST